MIAVALVLVASGCAPGPEDLEEKADTEARVSAKLALEEQLRDPDSVQYGTISVHRNAEGGRYVCGFYNAKNGFGGYAGEQPFFYSGASVATQKDVGTERFLELWKARCLG